MKCSSFALASLFLVLPAPSQGAPTPSQLQKLEARADNGELRAVIEDIDARLRATERRQLRFLKARLLAEAGHHDQAIAAYRDIIARYPDLPEPYNNLATLLADKGRLKEAQQLLEQAMRTHPSYAAIYENLSVVFVELARDSYGKALRIKQSNKSLAMQSLDSLSQPDTAETSTVATATQAKPIPPTRDTTSKQPPAPKLATATIRPTLPQPDEPQAKTEPIDALRHWADVWSDQAIDAYLEAYSDDYHPEQMSRTAWLQQRRNRLSAPRWIKVKLGDIEVTQLGDDTATVRLTQVYRSNTYEDRTRKQFKLRRTDNGWRITQEITLAQLPL